MILPSLEMGGMEQVVCRLARGLEEAGWRVGVTCTLVEGELAPALRDDGVPVRVIPLVGAGAWAGARNLVRHLLAVGPHVVHTHSGVWWRGVTAAARAGVPGRVHTVHGLLQREPWHGPLEKHLASRLTGAVVAVSPSLQHYLAHTAHVPRRRLHLLPNGVDTAVYAPAARGALRASLGLSPSAFVIGIVARLDPVKNIPLVYGPLAALVAAGVDAHFVIAGDGPERDMLIAGARQAGVSERVHFLGTIRESHLLYPELDLFVLPSRMEGTSISLLEAMASGVPCVATRVGGNPAVLAEGSAGVLIEDDDATALTEAFKSLAADAPERLRLSRAGRSRVEVHYSLAAMVSRYASIYSAVLGEPG